MNCILFKPEVVTGTLKQWETEFYVLWQVIMEHCIIKCAIVIRVAQFFSTQIHLSTEKPKVDELLAWTCCCNSSQSSWLLYIHTYICAITILRKARVRIPGQASKPNLQKKYFFDDFLSADFWQKLWNLLWKSFSKNLSFGVDFKL